MKSVIVAGVLALFLVICCTEASAQTGQSAVSDVGSPITIGRSFTFRSGALGGHRTINVYLPPSYESGSGRYRVLYLLDGGAAEDFHHISGLAQISAAYGLTDEFIVVGVEGVDRRHDLTSPSSVASDLKVAPTSGGADAYRRFLVEELKPWVAARYRTGGRDALIGESLAGLFVVETLLTTPGAFADYAAVSPSLWWNGQALSREAGPRLARHGAYAGHRLWLALAGGDSEVPEMRAATARLVADLGRSRPSGLEWTYRPMPGETHATVYHPAAMLAIRHLFAATAAGRGAP